MRHVADELYRWRWWLSAVLVGALVWLGASDTSPVTWSLFALLALLVWIPALMRWGQAARSARTAFGEGMTGTAATDSSDVNN